MYGLKKGTSIRQRLMNHFTKAVIIIALLFTVILGGVAMVFLVNQTGRIHEEQTNYVTEQISAWYSERISELKSIQTTVEYYDMTSDQSYGLREYLAKLLSENEDKGIYDYYIGMEDTTCYFAGGWEPEPGEYDPTTRDWYKKAVKRNGLYVSEAYVDADTGRIVITISLPIHVAGEIKGVLAADIFTDDIQKIAASAFDEDSSQYVILVDSAGTVLAHKNPDYIPTTDANGEEVLTSYTDAKIPEAVISAKELTKKVGSDHKGIFRIYTGRKIEEAEVSILVVDTGLHYYGGVFVFFLCCIVLGLVIIVIMRKGTERDIYPLLDPLAGLTEVAKKMSAGHLDYRTKYTADDEIGSLCKAVEQSNMTIREYIDDVSEKLEAISEGNLKVKVEKVYRGDFEKLKISINKIIEALNSSMKEILFAADSVHAKAQQVSDEASGMEKNVSDVSRRVDEVHLRIGKVKDGFNESLNQTNDSIGLSDEANAALKNCDAIKEELIKAMNRISEKSKSIADIINIIRDIATQTNLLALNASIEAARAGESGRGFAVVADNVRVLAEQTTSAVANSSNLINESVEAVEDGNRLVEETASSMQTAVEKTGQVNSLITKIADTIRANSEMLDDISERVVNMENFAEDTRTSSKEFVDMSSGLYSEADKMQDIVGKFEI